MKAPSTAYRSAVIVALAAPLLLVWLALAVGLLAEEGHPADHTRDQADELRRTPPSP